MSAPKWQDPNPVIAPNPKAKLSTLRLKRIYRYTFDMRLAGIGSVMLHTLIINPEDMNQDEPARNGVTQTLGGAYVTDFGSGLPTVEISGTTGYGKRISAEGLEVDGYEEFVNFRNKVYRSFISDPDPNLSLYWYNWEDNEYYEIIPQTFRLQRSKGAALLYRYNMRFTGIRRLTETRGEMRRDYLLDNPASREATLAIESAISNVGELIGLLNTGRGF
jgi:hypothetical protein